MPLFTVILINYKRVNNIHQIIDSIRSQTSKSLIWVWNNGPEAFENDQVDWIINSNINRHGYMLPYLYRQVDTEFICRMDDDLIFGDNTVLEDVLRMTIHHQNKRSIICGHGVQILDGKDYRNSTQLGCGKSYPPILEDTNVDIAKGRFTFFRQECAKDISFDTSHIHADLTTSFGISKKRRLCHIIPAFLEGRLIDLSSKYDDGSKGGYSSRGDHYLIRNRLTKAWVDQC